MLLSALEAFDRLGAVPWATRARAELAASGQKLGSRPATHETLTAQELHVSLLVAEGKTNREVATTLFLSEKTIEHHLHNAFAKLGVKSRTQLVRRLVSEEKTA
jgi:DNA-binding NarL/FixJ family response regulator